MTNEELFYVIKNGQLDLVKNDVDKFLFFRNNPINNFHDENLDFFKTNFRWVLNINDNAQYDERDLFYPLFQELSLNNIEKMRTAAETAYNGNGEKFPPPPNSEFEHKTPSLYYGIECGRYLEDEKIILKINDQPVDFEVEVVGSNKIGFNIIGFECDLNRCEIIEDEKCDTYAFSQSYYDECQQKFVPLRELTGLEGNFIFFHPTTKGSCFCHEQYKNDFRDC